MLTACRLQRSEPADFVDRDVYFRLGRLANRRPATQRPQFLSLISPERNFCTKHVKQQPTRGFLSDGLICKTDWTVEIEFSTVQKKTNGPRMVNLMGGTMRLFNQVIACASSQHSVCQASQRRESYAQEQTAGDD